MHWTVDATFAGEKTRVVVTLEDGDAVLWRMNVFLAELGHAFQEAFQRRPCAFRAQLDRGGTCRALRILAAGPVVDLGLVRRAAEAAVSVAAKHYSFLHPSEKEMA